MNEIVIAADLGGTNLRTAVIDEGGAVLFRTKRETARFAERPETLLAQIVESVDKCRAGCRNFPVKAVAVAVPATVSVERGLILKAPNLPALSGFPIAAALEKALGVRTIIENDANAAAIGENWLGASAGFADSIMITLGTGVGGGIIIDGKIVRGRDGTAGEIGHLPVEPFGGAACGCGARGCLEQYASATAIVRLARELKAQFPHSKLDLDSPSLSARDVFRAGKHDGDALAVEVFRRAGFYLGIALAGLINVLNPEIIVVGGGASAGWDLFLPQIRETIFERAYREPAERARLAPAALADDAGLKGVARLAFDLR